MSTPTQSPSSAVAGGYSAHPKPWTWERHELSTGLSCIVYDANGQRVGTDHLYPVDAALIAAAWNMQEALRAVEGWWLREGMNNHVGAPYAMFAARAALAKSTGQSQ